MCVIELRRIVLPKRILVHPTGWSEQSPKRPQKLMKVKRLKLREKALLRSEQNVDRYGSPAEAV